TMFSRDWSSDVCSSDLTTMRLPFPAFAMLLTPLALAEPLAPLPATTQGEGYAVLIVSRERLEVATTCEVALYVHDQMAARLHQRSEERRVGQEGGARWG